MAVLLILILAGLPDAQVRPQESPFARRYRALIEAYRAGDTDAAVNGLLALDQDAVGALVRQYVRIGARGFHSDPALDQAFFRAAAMLHADAAVRCWEELRVMECGAPLATGTQLVDVSERPNEGPGSFRRRWYLGTALVASRHLVSVDALDYFEEAVRKLPDDLPLLLAAGWFAERLSRSAASNGISLKNAQNLRRRHQQRGAKFLTAALAVDSQAAEASLRLARIEVSMGESEQARKRLTTLLARDDLQPAIAYLGKLMLGELHEQDGDPRQAERLYREAIALDAIAQSARVALAHLLYASGDSSAAADIIEPVVMPKLPPESNDPWPEYLHAYPVAGGIVLDELRKDVRR